MFVRYEASMIKAVTGRAVHTCWHQWHRWWQWHMTDRAWLHRLITKWAKNLECYSLNIIVRPVLIPILWNYILLSFDIEFTQFIVSMHTGCKLLIGHEMRDGQSTVSLSVSVSLFWRENDADNLAKRLSASFFCAGLLPVITPHPGTLHSPRWLPSSQVAKPQLLQPRRVFLREKGLVSSDF